MLVNFKNMKIRKMFSTYHDSMFILENNCPLYKKNPNKQLTEKWQKNKIIFLWKKVGLLGHLKIRKIDRSLGMSC